VGGVLCCVGLAPAPRRSADHGLMSRLLLWLPGAELAGGGGVQAPAGITKELRSHAQLGGGEQLRVRAGQRRGVGCQGPGAPRPDTGCGRSVQCDFLCDGSAAGGGPGHIRPGAWGQGLGGECPPKSLADSCLSLLLLLLMMMLMVVSMVLLMRVLMRMLTVMMRMRLAGVEMGCLAIRRGSDCCCCVAAAGGSSLLCCAADAGAAGSCFAAVCWEVWTYCTIITSITPAVAALAMALAHSMAEALNPKGGQQQQAAAGAGSSSSSSSSRMRAARQGTQLLAACASQAAACRVRCRGRGGGAGGVPLRAAAAGPVQGHEGAVPCEPWGHGDGRSRGAVTVAADIP